MSTYIYKVVHYSEDGRSVGQAWRTDLYFVNKIEALEYQNSMKGMHTDDQRIVIVTVIVSSDGKEEARLYRDALIAKLSDVERALLNSA